MSSPLVAKKILAAAVALLTPRLVEEIWEWAERCVVLDWNVTKDTGPFRARSYQRGEWSPFWAWLRFAQIDFIAATQVGKTLNMQLILGYVIDKDPGPTMIVFPNEKLSKRRSKKHLQPFIKKNLPHHLSANKWDISIFEYILANGMTVNLAHSGSPAQIAGEPIRYLLMDETAKFAPSTENEPGAEHNARERTKSMRPFAREWSCTTPTRETEPGWRNWPESTRCQFWVRCPHCNGAQVMYFGDIDRAVLDPEAKQPFAGGVGWDKDPSLSLAKRIESAYYQCALCPERWNDYDRNRAVAAGEWRAGDPYARRYAAHLSSLAAPATRLAEMVETWFKAFRDPEERQKFLNSWLAIPYIPEGQRAEESLLRSRVLPGHRRGMVPASAVAVFLTADIHDAHIRYRVRAWDSDGTSWGVEEGQLLPELHNLDAILRRQYVGTDGSTRGIDRALIDCNYRTDEVLQYCLQYPGVVFPVSGGRQKDLYTYHKRAVEADPDANPPRLLRGECIRIDIDDHRAKDNLFTIISQPVGQPGAWYLEEGIADDYFRQMQSEQRVNKIVKGRPVPMWMQLHENHALDCEKYQYIAFHVFQVANVEAERDRKAEKKTVQVYNPYTRQTITIQEP